MVSLLIPLMIAGGFDGVEPLRPSAPPREILAAQPRQTVCRSTELRGLGAAARRCGVSHTHLRKVLQGERVPSAALARKMSRLGLTPGMMKAEVK